MWCRHHLHNNNRIVIKEINGIKYTLDLREAIDSSIYYDSVWEPFETKIVQNHIKDNMAIIDVGANIGYFTLLFSKLSPNGRIIAFEPSFWAINKLMQNIDLNRFNNIEVEKIALSDELIMTRKHFRASWTIDGSETNLNDDENIIFSTLDDYILTHNIDKVDFIKIDVDGYEDKVIKGAIATLKRDMPMLLVELSPETYLLVLNTLEAIGYKIYSTELNKLSIDSIQILKDSTINVLCSKDDIHVVLKDVPDNSFVVGIYK